MNYLITEHEFFSSPEFIKFHKKVIYTHYCKLLSSIIRLPKDIDCLHPGAKYILDNYYMKGKLVARYSQENLARFMFTNQGAMSHSITDMFKMGLVRKHYRKVAVGRICYYELGEWKGSKIYGDDYQEILYGDEVFRHFAKLAKKKEGTDQEYEVTGSMFDFAGILNPEGEEYKRLYCDYLVS